MQQKQLIWLAGSLLALLALAYLTGTFDKEISTVDVPALSISSEQIERFEIVTSDSSTFVLEKENNIWRIKSPVDALADSLTISRFTENLDDMHLESVVSTNPSKYDEYGVGEAGKHINIEWGRNKRTFYIGSSGPDFQSFYVRLGTDPRVFLSSGRLNVPENLDTWRDKTLLDIPTEMVNKIAVTSPETAYDMLKVGTAWEITEDGDQSPADSSQMAQWLNRFSPLKATSFIDDMPAAEVKAAATHQVHFSVPGGSTQTLWILEEESRLVATVSGNPVTFRLAKSLISSFVPTTESLQTSN